MDHSLAPLDGSGLAAVSATSADHPRREESVSDGEEALDYATLRQDVVRAVARVCPRSMADRRDDLVQTAVMRVMQIMGKRSASGEGNQPLSTSYLYKVAYSVLVDEIRRLRRLGETDLGDEAVAPVAFARENPERTAASKEIGRGIEDCLVGMKRERRLAVTLHLLGHTVPEAARILDWAAKQTENLVYRGMADLRECLMAKGLRP
jgi:RNA polymerase sigma-70 factor (ECF subfamily)